MTIKNIITKKIKKNFPNAKFNIKDTTSKHLGHSQNNLKVESHFIINIESNKFSKLSKLVILSPLKSMAVAALTPT